LSRLTPTAGWLAAALFLAAGTWWLANMSLQAGSGFSGAPVVSAQAAYALVLGQWFLISLFASHGESQGFSAATVASLNFVVPLWPLIALLWLTSELSITTLVQTQLIAFTLAAVLAVVGTRVAHLNIDHEYRMLLRSTVGVAAAAAIWIGRSQLHAWVTA
jgi:hypothetical protein